MPDSIELKLTAKAFGMELQNALSWIKWPEQYTRWYDGDPGYSVLERNGHEK